MNLLQKKAKTHPLHQKTIFMIEESRESVRFDPNATERVKIQVDNWVIVRAHFKWFHPSLSSIASCEGSAKKEGFDMTVL